MYLKHKSDGGGDGGGSSISSSSNNNNSKRQNTRVQLVTINQQQQQQQLVAFVELCISTSKSNWPLFGYCNLQAPWSTIKKCTCSFACTSILLIAENDEVHLIYVCRFPFFSVAIKQVTLPLRLHPSTADHLYIKDLVFTECSIVLHWINQLAVVASRNADDICPIRQR